MSMMSLADIEVSVEKNTFLSRVFLPGSRQSTMTTLTLRLRPTDQTTAAEHGEDGTYDLAVLIANQSAAKS